MEGHNFRGGFKAFLPFYKLGRSCHFRVQLPQVPFRLDLCQAASEGFAFPFKTIINTLNADALGVFGVIRRGEPGQEIHSLARKLNPMIFAQALALWSVV